MTLCWNIAGMVVLAIAAVAARSRWLGLILISQSRSLQTEGRVTMVDAILATAVLAGLVLNAGPGWWQADPAAGQVLVFYAVREVREIFSAGLK